MITSKIEEITKDLIHVDFRVNLYKLEKNCFSVTDFLTIPGDSNSEIEVVVFEKDNKKLLEITAIVETQSEGTLHYTNYYINKAFEKSIKKYKL